MDKKIFYDENAWQAEWQKRHARIDHYCSRCVYNNLTPKIEFDDQGVCNYCKQSDELMTQFPGGRQGEAAFSKIVDQIKKAGKGKQYDVIVGVSGGADSSYMLRLAKDYGLRPLAVHFDNTWNSTIAVENIRNVLEKLDVELWTYVVDNEEYDDLYKAIFKASVPDLEAPTDLALAVTLNMAAAKHKIKYVFEGHSFKTEGMSPLGWLYMDAKYIHTMHKLYGERKKLKTYPYMWFKLQLKWMLFHGFKKIRPLWYLDYDKEAEKKILTEQYGWQWYGGHHLENRMTAFYHTYFLPRKFGIDQRANGFSAMIRSGQMDREEAIEELRKSPACDLELVEMVRKRWRYNEDEFYQILAQDPKYYTDFKTYKPLFERLRPFFYLMAKFELVPWSFYLKYTAKS